MTIYNIMWYFFIYAFLGWCTEVSFFAVKTGKFVNRGFLNGPVCPVYGFGLVIIIVALTPLKENLLLLFLGSVVITSSLVFCQLAHGKTFSYKMVGLYKQQIQPARIYLPRLFNNLGSCGNRGYENNSAHY